MQPSPPVPTPHRKRYRLADGRYLYELTPSVFILQNAFQNALCELPVEYIEYDAEGKNAQAKNSRDTG
jgi:hypothetical protein